MKTALIFGSTGLIGGILLKLLANDQKYKKIVMKFGGTPMADMDCISKVADHIERELSNGTLIAAVVSAMAGETDRLISLADQAGNNTQQSERDVIISTAEQVSSAVLSMILNIFMKKDYPLVIRYYVASLGTIVLCLSSKTDPSNLEYDDED